MESLDYYYLELQFMERIYTLKGERFQALVEGIFERKYPGFDKVRPYGSYGDGGNDGFRRDSGIYYQVYAPLDPAIRDGEAAKKFREDFIKLYENWNNVVEIKEYNFIFNDQYKGTNIPLETEIQRLSQEYPNVAFGVILSNKLKEIFLSLQERDFISLHFSVDRLEASEIAGTILRLASTEIDKENILSAKKILDSCERVIQQQKNQEQKIKYATLQAKCLQKLEEYEPAKSLLEELVRKNPDSFVARISLAELYLAMDLYEKNKQQLEAAFEIDSSNPLNFLCSLARKINMEEDIEINELQDLALLGTDPKIVSSYYRLAGIAVISGSSNFERGLSYIQKAIHHNPEKLENYRLELQFRTLMTHVPEAMYEYSSEWEVILRCIDELIETFGGTKTISARANLYINKLKSDIYGLQSDGSSFLGAVSEIVSTILNCYFSKDIDTILNQTLSAGKLDQQSLEKILNYLVQAGKKLSRELTNALITQLNYSDELADRGDRFFHEVGDVEAVSFIKSYSNGDFNKVLERLNSDKLFAVMFIDSIGIYSETTEQLINSLSLDDFTKNRLRLHLCYNSDKHELAFSLVKGLDITKIGPIEIMEVLDISRKYDAWDIEIDLLKRLSALNRNKLGIDLKYKLFDALMRARKYKDAIALGKEILKEDADNIPARQYVFHNTLFACYERSKIDREVISEAIGIIDRFSCSSASFGSKLSVIPEIYILDSQYTNAYKSILEAIKERNGLTENEYARLHIPVYFKIGAHIDEKALLCDKVENGSFVKLRESGQWYHIGDESPLDTILVESTTDKYNEFIGKKVGDEVNLSSRFSSLENKETIASIVPIYGYIHQKILAAFQRLAPKDLVPGVHQFEILKENGEIDKEGFTKTLKSMSGGDDFLEMYCTSPIPFAFLATNQGGLLGGIQKILGEGRGYINSSSGSIADFEQQVLQAKRAISGDLSVYLEGTAATFLIEHGFLELITKHLPNLKVPHSVLLLLSSLAEDFSVDGRSSGRLGLENGELFFRENDEGYTRAHSRIVDAVRYIENSAIEVPMISAASKSSEFIEQMIKAEFSDASILARRDNSMVLTDDYMYLRASESLLGYAQLPDFSSMAFIRALYELGYVRFLDYLHYFNFLSGYRVRFLHLFPLDIVTAVLGDGLIKEFNPKNVLAFNFRLTLSEDYGVDVSASSNLISYVLAEFILGEFK